MIINKSKIKPYTMGRLGVMLVGSLSSISCVDTLSNPFQLNKIDKSEPELAEGKCGEGKCGSSVTLSDSKYDTLSDEDRTKITQEYLTSAGYAPGPSDGILGNKTRSAISAYQRSNDLAVDGSISKELFVSLEKHIQGGSRYGQKKQSKSTYDYLPDTVRVKYIQNWLSDLNYYSGPKDGVLNSKTRSSIKSFQSSNNLQVNGKISRALWDSLQSKANQKWEASTMLAKTDLDKKRYRGTSNSTNSRNSAKSAALEGKCGEGKCGAAMGTSTSNNYSNSNKHSTSNTKPNENDPYREYLDSMPESNFGNTWGVLLGAVAKGNADLRAAKSERKAREQAQLEEQRQREREAQRQREYQQSQIAMRNAQIAAINAQKDAAYARENQQRQSGSNLGYHQPPSRSGSNGSGSSNTSGGSSGGSVVKWKTEQCNYSSHHHFYKAENPSYITGPGVHYATSQNYYKVKVTNNCQYKILQCSVKYSTRIYDPNTTNASNVGGWNQQSSETLIVHPRQTQYTNGLGPAVPGATGYKTVTCKSFGGTG